MSVYFDTSAVVPVFMPDPFAVRIEAFFLTGPSGILISDFVSAEFASVVGVRLRSKLIDAKAAQEALANFDVWTSATAASVPTQSSDISAAGVMVRRLDLPLRAPDAIHIAIAQRLGAELATFDRRMADCARALGVTVAPL